MAAPGAGIEDVADAVPQQVEGDHRNEDGQAGIDHQPRRRLDIAASLGEHVAPFRRRRLDAEAQERQAGNAQHRGADIQHRRGQQRGQRIGDQVRGKDMAAFRARGLRRGDIVPLLDLQHGTAG